MRGNQMSGSRPLINHLESEGDGRGRAAAPSAIHPPPQSACPSVRPSKFQTRGHRSISLVGVIFLEMCARRQVVILSTRPLSPSYESSFLFQILKLMEENWTAATVEDQPVPVAVRTRTRADVVLGALGG